MKTQRASALFFIAILAVFSPGLQAQTLTSIFDSCNPGRLGYASPGVAVSIGCTRVASCPTQGIGYQYIAISPQTPAIGCPNAATYHDIAVVNSSGGSNLGMTGTASITVPGNVENYSSGQSPDLYFNSNSISCVQAGGFGSSTLLGLLLGGYQPFDSNVAAHTNYAACGTSTPQLQASVKAAFCSAGPKAGAWGGCMPADGSAFTQGLDFAGGSQPSGCQTNWQPTIADCGAPPAGGTAILPPGVTADFCTIFYNDPDCRHVSVASNGAIARADTPIPGGGYTSINIPNVVHGNNGPSAYVQLTDVNGKIVPRYAYNTSVDQGTWSINITAAPGQVLPQGTASVLKGMPNGATNQPGDFDISGNTLLYICSGCLGKPAVVGGNGHTIIANAPFVFSLQPPQYAQTVQIYLDAGAFGDGALHVDQQYPWAYPVSVPGSTINVVVNQNFDSFMPQTPGIIPLYSLFVATDGSYSVQKDWRYWVQ